MALERDYLVAFMAVHRWLEEHLGSHLLTQEQIEAMSRFMLDAVDMARERRQRDH